MQGFVTLIKQGGKVLVDRDIADWLFGKNWFLTKQGNEQRRVVVWEGRPKLRNYLHRIIMGAGPGQIVDHINRNPLDNRRENLRIIDRQNNHLNTSAHIDNKSSRCKGVTYFAYPGIRNKRWLTQIKFGNLRKKCYFKTEKEAALQYNAWALELHKEYAVLNVNNWKEDLKFGNEAEEWFCHLHKGKLTKLDGFKSDLVIVKTGEGIELKTERRKLTDTNNIFLEKYSHKGMKTPGGPYKALQNNSEYFICFFRNCNIFFTYRTKDLVEYLNNNEAKYAPKYIKTSKALGYAVPIADLKHLELDFNQISV